MVPPRNSAFRDSTVLLITTVASAVLAAAYLAIAARWLGPAQYGTVSALMALGALIGLVSGPIETAVAKLAAVLPVPRDARRVGEILRLYFGEAGKWMLGISLGCLALMPLIGRWLSEGDRPAYLLLIAYVAMLLVGGVPRGILRGQHRFTEFAFAQVVDPAVRLLVGVPLLAMGPTAGHAMLGYVAGAAASLCFSLWSHRDVELTGPRGDLKPLLQISSPMFVVFAYGQVINNIDLLAAKRFLEASDAGRYAAAVTLTRFVGLASASLNEVLLSHVASRRAAGSSTWSFAGRFIGIAAALSILTLLIPWFGGAPILSTVFGSAFGGGAQVLSILWLKTAVLLVENLLLVAYFASDRTRGFGLMAAPAIATAASLLFFHTSGVSIALCSLAGTAAGFLPLIAMGRMMSRRESTLQPNP